MWSDSSANALYSFGGDSSWRAPVNKTTFPNRFQTFNPDGSGGGRWSSDLGRTDENVPDDIIPPVGGYISQTQGTGIYLGGYEPFASVAKTRYERPSDAVALPGIVTFDFENRTWTNDTIAPYAPGGSVGYGAMHYVPNLGPAGLLAIFGGESETAGAPSERLMDDITMYEREGKTWHHQIANGFVLPRYRKGMCAVGVQEDGQGSYEMYIPRSRANRHPCSPLEFVVDWLMYHPPVSSTAVTPAHLGLSRAAMMRYGSQPSSGSRFTRPLRFRASVTLAIPWAIGT